MRLVLVVAIAALVLGACGEEGDSPSAGPTQQALSGAGAGASAGASGGEASEGSRARGSEWDRKRSGTPQARRQDFTGSASVIYYKARSRCLVLPPRGLARAYQAASTNPRAIARAYADRESPARVYRRAAIAGCLDGLSSNPR